MLLPVEFHGQRSRKVCSPWNCKGFDPHFRKIPWGRKWAATPVLLPVEFHGQRSRKVCSPWNCKESDTIVQLASIFTFPHFCNSFRTGLSLPAFQLPFIPNTKATINSSNKSHPVSLLSSEPSMWWSISHEKKEIPPFVTTQIELRALCWMKCQIQ